MIFVVNRLKSGGSIPTYAASIAQTITGIHVAATVIFVDTSSRSAACELLANSNHRVISMKEPITTVNRISTQTALTAKTRLLVAMTVLGAALGLAAMGLVATTSVASSHLPTTAPVPGAMIIDLLPGNPENTINLASQRIIPIAILGSADFDINDLNPRTLKLRAVSQNLVGKSDKSLCHQLDINGDSFMDLLCDFKTIGLHVEPGDIAIVINAGTYQRQSLHADGVLRYIVE